MSHLPSSPPIRLGCDLLRLCPSLWPALDSARHGIAKDEQEALFQRVRASANPRQLDDFARLMDDLLGQGLDATSPGFGHHR